MPERGLVRQTADPTPGALTSIAERSRHDATIISRNRNPAFKRLVGRLVQGLGAERIAVVAILLVLQHLTERAESVGIVPYAAAHGAHPLGVKRFGGGQIVDSEVGHGGLLKSASRFGSEPDAALATPAAESGPGVGLSTVKSA
ncbi:hypothetical protein ebA2849 [Aromatoleum aromaticum EbN1]|uniref:Uncharacterized protein n=1 Tax=Aromatoleum aromaticum (strain DSM 19018 / LMG 30748 / EbN1) TaxID=76114 RepID=Q5P4N7_AROAE|nr:hypothetical protein ebA2849 [Aromatoleum aromaticum EbN1]